MTITWGDKLVVSAKMKESDFRCYYTYLRAKNEIDKNTVHISNTISTTQKFHVINNIKVPKKFITIVEKDKRFHKEYFYKYAELMCYDIRNRDYAVIMCDGEYYDNLDNHMRSHSDLICAFVDCEKDGIRERGSDDFEELLVGHIVDNVFFIERDTLKCDINIQAERIAERYNVDMIYLFSNYESNPNMELILKKTLDKN